MSKTGDTGRQRIAAVILTICLAFVGVAWGGENWPGIEGGGPRHNASAHAVEPFALGKVWQRTFPCLPIGDQEGPNNERLFSAGKGARNLVLIDGKLALIATESSDVANEENDYYCTVLDAPSGGTLNWVHILSSQGNNRAYRWPHYCVSASSDNVCGIVQVGWDPQTEILYASQGAYLSSYTGWLPLANKESHTPDVPQEAIPAFAGLSGEHPGFQDAFGRTRAEMWTVFGPSNRIEGMQPYTWGLSGFYVVEDHGREKEPRYDLDLETVYGRQGSSYYNTSSHFHVDPGGPLLVQCKGADWGHNSAGDAYVFNKHTGMKALVSMPYPGEKRLRPFTVQGAMIHDGRLYCAGPSSGDLGVARPEGRVPKMDQGLYLWAYDIALSDEKPNDGFEGPGCAETATLTPAFVYEFPSRFEPDPDDIESYGQSYYECDGFYRQKAMLIDDGSMWMAWKPSQEEPVELIHASDEDATAYSLEVGEGAKGVDLWPKISLSEIGSQKYITYFTGYANHRTRFMPDDPVEALKEIHGEAFDQLSEKEIENTKRQAPQAGLWNKELLPPRSPAALAVFDATDGKLRWTYNVSKNHPSIPANEFWTYLDKSQMVVAGKWAYVGWVDLTGDEAAVRLLAFDITAEEPSPVERVVPLGFPTQGNGKTALFDLIAADGMLYALVTQSNRLWIRDPRWTFQHVIALGPAA